MDEFVSHLDFYMVSFSFTQREIGAEPVTAVLGHSIMQSRVQKGRS